ncbi:MAG: hypothetical protein BWK73_21755 [Thiothrix lacustris]|uniref:Uncharacterized protein n=1 Tax=Thiothrix lacustris TaxID=525917 RepID=A0A1Y1QNA2_9GAMM|nr:MAG: hypothetical protein BWK73_21755 [Thiothrix lacustris]
MIRFRDVFIHLDHLDEREVFEEITKSCNEFWERAYEKEKNMHIISKSGYCFEHKEEDSLPAAGLVILNKENNTWYIPNIVPLKKGKLSYDEYNDLAENFTKTILQKAQEKYSFNVELTSDSITSEEILGEESAKLLKKFSNLANKSTGSSHPSDQKRWFDFIYSVSLSKEVYADQVEKILIEHGWSEDYADKLALEFEFAQALISHKR